MNIKQYLVAIHNFQSNNNGFSTQTSLLQRKNRRIVTRGNPRTTPSAPIGPPNSYCTVLTAVGVDGLVVVDLSAVVSVVFFTGLLLAVFPVLGAIIEIWQI